VGGLDVNLDGNLGGNLDGNLDGVMYVVVVGSKGRREGTLGKFKDNIAIDISRNRARNRRRKAFGMRWENGKGM